MRKYENWLIGQYLGHSCSNLQINTREILAGGLNVHNHHIPEGIVVGTPHYAIHHNVEYYPDPFKYRPERWIVDPGTDVQEKDVDLAHSAFCAFSIGPRGCIGKGVAYMELMTALAGTYFIYDMRLAP